MKENSRRIKGVYKEKIESVEWMSEWVSEEEKEGRKLEKSARRCTYTNIHPWRKEVRPFSYGFAEGFSYNAALRSRWLRENYRPLVFYQYYLLRICGRLGRSPIIGECGTPLWQVCAAGIGSQQHQPQYTLSVTNALAFSLRFSVELVACSEPVRYSSVLPK